MNNYRSKINLLGKGLELPPRKREVTEHFPKERSSYYPLFELSGIKPNSPLALQIMLGFRDSHLDLPRKKRAVILRTIGEIYENMRNLDSAIEYYQQALDLNPRAGVKERLQVVVERRNQKLLMKSNRDASRRSVSAGRHQLFLFG